MSIPKCLKMQQKSGERGPFRKVSVNRILIFSLIVVTIIGSIILVDMSLNQPTVTMKTSTKDVTVNVPFSVTISTNRYAKNTQYEYVVNGYGNQISAWMTKKTMIINVTITENDYQQLLEGQGIWGPDWNKPIPNSVKTTLTLEIDHFTYGVTNPVSDGTASINIVVNNSS